MDELLNTCTWMGEIHVHVVLERLMDELPVHVIIENTNRWNTCTCTCICTC